MKCRQTRNKQKFIKLSPMFYIQIHSFLRLLIAFVAHQAQFQFHADKFSLQTKFHKEKTFGDIKGENTVDRVFIHILPEILGGSLDGTSGEFGAYFIDCCDKVKLWKGNPVNTHMVSVFSIHCRYFLNILLLIVP